MYFFLTIGKKMRRKKNVIFHDIDKGTWQKSSQNPGGTITGALIKRLFFFLNKVGKKL